MSRLRSVCRHLADVKRLITVASGRERTRRAMAENAAISLIRGDCFRRLLELFYCLQAFFCCGIVPIATKLNDGRLLAMDGKATLATRQSPVTFCAFAGNRRGRVPTLVAAAVRRAATGFSKSAMQTSSLLCTRSRRPCQSSERLLIVNINGRFRLSALERCGLWRSRFQVTHLTWRWSSVARIIIRIGVRI